MPNAKARCDRVSLVSEEGLQKDREEEAEYMSGHGWNAAVIFSVALGASVAASTTGAQSTTGQGGATAKQSTPQSVTLTGCLRQASDDARLFGLVPSPDANKTTGTSGSLSQAPLYRLEDKGQNLKGHVGYRVEVTGTVTPAKDEKGADIVVTRSERVGVPTTTVTTIDLKPAPRLDITSVKRVSGDCPKATTAGTSGTSSPATASVGEISEHPERFINQKVKVTGEVEKIFNAHTFSLDEDRVFSTGVDVLVLSKRPNVVKDNQRATVTGVVRRFVRAELQKEIVDFDLRPEWLVDFESRPVIIATDVTVAK